MNIKPTTLLVLLVFCGSRMIHGGPLKWSTLDEMTIHTGAVKAVATIAETYADTPFATEAESIMHHDHPGYAWFSTVFSFVSGLLNTHPPAETNQAIRELALTLLDYPLHVDNLRPGVDPKLATAWRGAVSEYYQAGMKMALREIEATKTDNGLIIWKLYNMGFIVRSKNHTIGFDVHPGVYGTLTGEQRSNLVSQIDILFLSHAHGDHINGEVVSAMLAAGKRVVMPPGIDVFDDPAKLILHLYDNYKVTTDLGGVKVRCFPGTQDQLPCSVYAVTIDGFTISHNGDNGRTNIYEEISKAAPVDVALANCWSGLRAYVDATHPALVIVGHENELSHEVAKRESYAMSFQRLREAGIQAKAFILNWGESVRYPR